MEKKMVFVAYNELRTTTELDAVYQRGHLELQQTRPARIYGIEHWQRDEVFLKALERGRTYERAMQIALRFPKAWLPEIVFEWDGKSSPVPMAVN